MKEATFPKKSKDESLKELRKQYADAVDEKNQVKIKILEAIFKRIGEAPRSNQLSKALNKRSK